MSLQPAVGKNTSCSGPTHNPCMHLTVDARVSTHSNLSATPTAAPAGAPLYCHCTACKAGHRATASAGGCTAGKAAGPQPLQGPVRSSCSHHMTLHHSICIHDESSTIDFGIHSSYSQQRLANPTSQSHHPTLSPTSLDNPHLNPCKNPAKPYITRSNPAKNPC